MNAVRRGFPPPSPWFVAFGLLLFLGAVPAPADTGSHGDRTHWAYDPVEKATIPKGEHPVDYFIERRLEEAGLARNPGADRHTLLRRATLDLTGLPPTREEIDAFVSDSSPDAWERLVDRLLASPHYGERWGRHWLDVARYVQGSIKVPGVDRIDLAEPYRDYVVRSFNADKPYDRFLAEQLAGDLLGSPDESLQERFDRLTAPAFLSIGPWFEECTDPNKLRLDIIDEQISTTTRAFLALDFACSRCHDHKYDPIPTRDYYALAGIFRSTDIHEDFADEWKDGRPRALRSLASEEELLREKVRRSEIEELLDRRRGKLENLRETSLPARETFESPGPLADEVLRFEAEDFAGHKNLETATIGGDEVVRTRRRLDQWVKYRIIIPEPGDYTLLVRYASPGPAPVDFEIEGETRPERVLGRPTHGDTPEDFRWTPLALPDLEKGSLHLRFKVDRNEPFPVLDTFRLVAGSLDADETGWRKSLGEPTLAEVTRFLTKTERRPITELETRIHELRESAPDPDYTLAVRDREDPVDLAVHTGGAVYRTEGDPVPRGVPGLADHIVPTAFVVDGEESGRRELARWMTHPDHPLTARVMVNRIWHWHFGRGLVRTVDDFGKQGSPPTHPELLDWLAAEFIESGWSIKHLHRLLLTSDTYRASSRETEENLERDPNGSLLSRYPTRRLEVEAIYDSMLTSIGKVPRQEPGEPLDTSRSKDRALYILTSGRSPMGLGIEIRKMLDLFGFDDSGRPMHDRDESTTAQQALWWLNNPLPRHYAEGLAERILSETDDVTERVDGIHRIILGRPPSQPAERAMLTYVDELTDDGLPEEEAWTRICLGLFSTRAFRTLD